MAKQQIKLENTFGRLAIARGMATPAQVEESLRAMKKLADLGMREKLGSVMVKKGYLSRGEVAQILDMQGKRASSRIEGYEIQSKLGQGAMGSVYRAKQVSLDRIVALKILSPRLAKDKSYVRRFLTEARSVAKLNHANIIQGIDVGESNKHFYFAMEYVDGVTLIEILREEGPFEEKRALEIMESIAEALDHAHRNGLVHRDVKPDNIMVTQAGDAKLCDLGLAKSATKGASATNVGNVVGTPHYIAPEQARGEHHVDIRVDIYSLGATLFHILTGRTPYSGENPTVVMTKHLTDPVDDVRGIRPELSEGVAFLVYKMMAKSARHGRAQARARQGVDDEEARLRAGGPVLRCRGRRDPGDSRGHAAALREPVASERLFQEVETRHGQAAPRRGAGRPGRGAVGRGGRRRRGQEALRAGAEVRGRSGHRAELRRDIPPLPRRRRREQGHSLRREREGSARQLQEEAGEGLQRPDPRAAR